MNDTGIVRIVPVFTLPGSTKVQRSLKPTSAFAWAPRSAPEFARACNPIDAVAAFPLRLTDADSPRQAILEPSEKESCTVSSGTDFMLWQPSTLKGLLPTTLEATPPMVAADATGLVANSATAAKLHNIKPCRLINSRIWLGLSRI